MGDPARADAALLPSISWSTDATDLRFGRHMEVQCSYVAAQENLMDLPHAPFLHSAADCDWRELPSEIRWPIELHVDARVLARKTTFNASSPWPLHAELFGFDSETKVTETLAATFTAPGCYLLESENEVLGPKASCFKKYGYRGLHCTTPITARSCHWWWSYTYDHGQHAIEQFLGFWDRILKEDRDLLESIQANIDRDTRDNLRQVLVSDDLAIGKLRRIIRNMLDAESPTQSKQIAQDLDSVAQA
jgi:vanillate O-demethylase monooxygenase subunit